MDPLTQGAIGAALPLATRNRSQILLACGLGFLAGMAPDLDILIKSSEDPLFVLEFHRQFTHSLIFIPIGGGILAGIFYAVFSRWRSIGFLRIWLFCSLGYGTHGLLDSATSYGTLLFWPFDDTRYALSIISIVDPLFTLPILGMVLAGIRKNSGKWGRTAILWGAIYLTAGVWQHHSAMLKARDLAEKRGHVPARLTVKPTFGNIILWRSVYEYGGQFYVDAIRPRPCSTTFSGTSITKLDKIRDFNWLEANSTQAMDIDRFSRLSQGYLAKMGDHRNRIIDVRYGFIPTEISALWSIRLNPNAKANEHAIYETDRSRARNLLPVLIRMILDCP